MLRRNKRRESGQGGWGGEARIVIPAHERRKPRTCGGLLAVVENRADVDVAEAMRKEASAEQRRAAQKWQLLGRFHAKWYQHDRQKGPSSPTHRWSPCWQRRRTKTRTTTPSRATSL